MATSLCCSPLISSNIMDKPSARKSYWMSDAGVYSPKNVSFQPLKMKATDNSSPRTKPDSLLCADCEGAGCKNCSQCDGKGVNIVDHFNGQFKAGADCWLCGGKKQVLCGNCNGAGFVGGFMSTYDE